MSDKPDPAVPRDAPASSPDTRLGQTRLFVESPIDVEAIKSRLQTVCFGYRWTDVLILVHEIERLRAALARPEPPQETKDTTE